MWWKKILLGVGVAVAVGSALGACWWLDRGPRELRLPGVVETQEVRLGSRVGGRVSKVAVREGELVRAGQVVVELESVELEARRAQLQAALEAAQAQLARALNGPRAEEKAAARATADAARARLQRLRTGPRPEEVEAAHGEWQGLVAELQRAQREWDREPRLQSRGASPAAQSEIALAGFHRLKEQAGAAKARWQLLANGSRAEDIAEAEAEYARAQAQAEQLERGSRAEDIAEARAKVAELYARVNEAESQLREARILALEDALVEVVAVRPGDTPAANQTLVRVLRNEDLWVKVYVPEPELGKVRLNQEVTLTTDSYPGRRFRGQVTHVASVSEFTPRNVQTADERLHQVFAVKVRVTDPAGVFKSGMAAEVFLPLHPAEEN